MINLVLLFFLIPALSYSDSYVGAAQSQLLQSSRNSKEVRSVEQIFTNYLNKVEICESELKLRVIPTSCYEVLWLNKKLSLIKQTSHKQEVLDLLCKERSTKIKNSKSEEFKHIHKKWMSKACREKLYEQRKRLLYIEAESHPEVLFFN